MEPKLLLNYKLVEETIAKAQSGQKPYISMYFLNPSMQWSDILLLLVLLTAISLLRRSLAGVYHPKQKSLYCLLRPLSDAVAKPKYGYKFRENLWYTLWHSFSFSFGIYTLMQMRLTPEHPGWTRLLFRQLDIKWYWFPTAAESAMGNLGWPSFPMTSVTKLYYLTELAFWLSCLIFLFYEARRSDFNALLVHHHVTCFLIMFSYCLSFWRIGTIILIIHDVADIFLYMTKTAYSTKSPPVVIDSLFLTFAVVFFISRLILFPLLCIRPVVDLNKISIWTNGIIASHWQIPGGVILPCFLCVLQILHIFWFGLILKMIWKSYNKAPVSTAGDIRSDSESSEMDLDSEDEKKDDCSDADQRMRLSSLPGVRATSKSSHRSFPDQRKEALAKKVT